MSDSASSPPPLFTAANALTVARLLLLPVAVYGLAARENHVAAGAIVAAWLTDLADGQVARKVGPVNPAGRTLDTAVDFCFIFGLSIAFYATA